MIAAICADTMGSVERSYDNGLARKSAPSSLTGRPSTRGWTNVLLRIVPSCRSSKRQRRVVLTPVVVDAIDEPLDAVLAPAAVIMTDRPNARADIIHDVSERVELCRPVQVCEPLTAQQGQLVGQVAL